MTNPLPISLCMIVKNEEAFLNTTLKAAKHAKIFNEIVVVDTGSTDDSIKIANKNGAKVFNFEWVNDFSAAKNFAAACATNDWVLSVDADEEIVEAKADVLKDFIKNPLNIGAITLVEMLDSSHNKIARLYNKTKCNYTGIIHEYITAMGSETTTILPVPIQMRHHGYLPQFGRTENKLKRNEELLISALKNDPNDPYILFQLGKSYFCANRNLEKACDYFEKALSQNPNPKLEYVYNLVECYGYALINTNKAAEAMKLRSRFLVLYNNIVQFRFLSAHIFQSNAMFIEAVECYETCIGAEGDDFKGITSYLSYYNIGVILEVVNMTKEAIDVYKKCGNYAPAKKRLKEMRKK